MHCINVYKQGSGRRLEGEIPQTLRRALSPALVDCFFVAIFFETQRVNIREYASIHVNTRLFTHRVSAGALKKQT